MYWHWYTLDVHHFSLSGEVKAHERAQWQVKMTEVYVSDHEVETSTTPEGPEGRA